MASDIELLEAWRAGAGDAGEQLFERYYDSVYRFFRHKLEEDVSDLVQDTFFALLEGMDRVRQAASFRSYLFAIAHHVFYAHLRSAYRAALHDDYAQMSMQDLAPGPSTVYAQHQDQRLLLEALRRLPVDDQVILELRYWEHLKTIEIADVLGLPHPTVRSRLKRAHARLEAELTSLAATAFAPEQTLVSATEWARGCRDRLDQADSD